MLVKLIGWLYVVLAIYLLAKPGRFKEWMKHSRSNKKILALPIVFGAIMILIALQFKGISATIIMILGCLGVLKGFIFLLYQDIYKKVMDWALELPVSLYRVGGCFHVIVGIIIVSLN